MKNVEQFLDRHYQLSPQSKELLFEQMEIYKLPKAACLISEVELSPYLYFIEKGAVKNHYIDSDGNKKVVWFGFEGDVCFSLNSYMDCEYIYETHELLEDSTFYRVRIDQMKKLYQNHLDWANWGRCFMEYCFVKLVKEVDEYKSRTATERYQDLVGNQTQINERVPLKDIASYLGVSPVTISRLRKEL